MSPPNQTPQLYDVHDGNGALKLENEGAKEGAAVTSAAEPPKHNEAESEPIETKREAGNSQAGQAPAPQDDAEKVAEKAEGTTEETTEEKTEETVEEEGKEEGKEEEKSPRPATPPPALTEKAAGKAPVRSPSPPPPPPKDKRYLSTSNPPSRATSPIKSSGRNSEDADATEYSAKYDGNEDAVDNSQSEIQSIMEQFEAGHGGPGAEEIMSPRLEMAQPMLESPIVHPPRRSSLQPVDKPLPTPTEGTHDEALHSPPPPLNSSSRVGTSNSLADSMASPMSPSAHAPLYQKPAPPPDPEPDLPFDFHRFLEQLRHRTADPVAKFLRSFLLEFGKKQWMVHEQVKIIADFLEFISKKMAQCDVWRTVSDAEFDNAREGMEKLVMNRLYSQTFSPAIPPPEPVPHTKGRRRPEPLNFGRRGQHQEDVERDEILAQKVRIYKWVREEHLDIPSVGEKGKKFLHLAQQELLKIKSYRAPRDKVICILNCCKVIFGYLRTSSSDMSADAFVPLLIYTVLQANPDHLVSNVQYILRFRNQEKLGGEAGYYISSLMGAIQFVEGLDKTSLTISDEEFEKNVEAAVSAIAERHAKDDALPVTPTDPSHPLTPRLQNPPATPGHRRMPSPHSLHLSEKSTISRPEITTRHSQEGERAGPRRSTSLRNDRTESTQQDQPDETENAAVAGLLRTIQRPLTTIGRIFSDNDNTPTTSSGPASTPRGATPSTHDAEKRAANPNPLPSPNLEAPNDHKRQHRQRLSAEDAAARQASAEAEEARRIQRQEHTVVVETLAGMFPQLDRDVIDDVVRLKEGRVGLAVDACLALANP